MAHPDHEANALAYRAFKQALRDAERASYLKAQAEFEARR